MLATGTFSVSKKASPDSCKRCAAALPLAPKPPWASATSTCERARAMFAVATRRSLLAARAWRTNASRRGSWYSCHQFSGTGAETTLSASWRRGPFRSPRCTAAFFGTA